MKMRSLRALTLALMASPTAFVVAAEAPVAVSPGSSTGTLIAASCPTFSWGQVKGAESYELIVYRVGDHGEEAETVLHQRLDGAVGSWTPALERCLDRDAQYAWTVRALGGKGASHEWSSPSLFKVTPGTSEAEFEEALSIVKRYLIDRGEALEPNSLAGANLLGSDREARSGMPSRESTIAQPTAETLLSVDGNVDAISFTGDGSALTNLPTSGDCQGGGRYEDNGDGTVTDCRSGLIWLQEASCPALAGPNGRAEWDDSLAAVAALAAGQCGLTDGSEAGMWRLATATEWTAMVTSARRQGFTAPTLTDSAGDAQWTEGDPFLAVQSGGGGYWSSTEIDITTAHDLKFVDGNLDPDDKSETNWVWPVRIGPSTPRVRVRTGAPSALCVDTDTLLGGGCDCTGRGVSASRPHPTSNGWQCTCTGSPFNGDATAYCLLADG